MTTISQIQFIAPPPPPPSYRSILSINPTAPIAAPKMKYLPTPLRIYWTSLDDVNTLNQWTDKPNLIKITCSCSNAICVSDFNLADKLRTEMIQASRVWLVFASGLRILMGLTWPRLAVLLQKNRRGMVVKTGVIFT